MMSYRQPPVDLFTGTPARVQGLLYAVGTPQ
jgi:hypothetical protein